MNAPVPKQRLWTNTNELRGYPISLWSSTPDQELFDLAARKQLVANLDSQVKRMLKDPRSGALTENFAMQWLQLRRRRRTPQMHAVPKVRR
jgi:hypothetical protein